VAVSAGPIEDIRNHSSVALLQNISSDLIVSEQDLGCSGVLVLFEFQVVPEAFSRELQSVVCTGAVDLRIDLTPLNHH